ncbi:MAG: hypothetical protein CMO55_29100 [Verrucomicrobiales bacterium]|nr:hypothetical protein [Verrucomicrobiales bacterium]
MNKDQKAISKEETVSKKPIRLIRSTTNYATFVKRTTQAMKLTGKAASKSKPNKQLLSLARIKS